jgi:hypothetical protein
MAISCGFTRHLQKLVTRKAEDCRLAPKRPATFRRLRANRIAGEHRKRQAFQPFAVLFKIGRQRQSKSHYFPYILIIYRTKATNKRLAKQRRRDRVYLRGEQVKQPFLFWERAP